MRVLGVLAQPTSGDVALSGTIKMRMGATHFLTKTLPKVATEMALCVLTYNLTRVLNIVGVPAVLEAIKG